MIKETKVIQSNRYCDGCNVLLVSPTVYSGNKHNGNFQIFRYKLREIDLCNECQIKVTQECINSQSESFINNVLKDIPKKNNVSI